MAAMKNSIFSSIFVVFTILAVLAPVPIRTQVANNNDPAAAAPKPSFNIANDYTGADVGTAFNMPAQVDVNAGAAPAVAEVRMAKSINPNVPDIYSQGGAGANGMLLAAPQNYDAPQAAALSISSNPNDPSASAVKPISVFTMEQKKEIEKIVKIMLRKEAARRFSGMNMKNKMGQIGDYDNMDMGNSRFRGGNYGGFSGSSRRNHDLRKPYMSAGAGGFRNRRFSGPNSQNYGMSKVSDAERAFYAQMRKKMADEIDGYLSSSSSTSSLVDKSNIQQPKV